MKLHPVTPGPRPEVVRLREAAEMLDVTPKTVRRLIERGILPRVAHIRHIRISAEAVRKLIAGGPPEPAAPGGPDQPRGRLE
jgi:excisionase family DNA binding protein